MTKIESIKSAVSVPDAAERYGMTVSRNGSALCPFHNDHHPSLRLYDDHYHCFTCGAHGDVIDLTTALFSLSPRDAVEKLYRDFSIPGSESDTRKSPRFSQNRKNLCLYRLLDYLQKLRTWKSEYAPKSADEEPDARFTEACREEDKISYYISVFLSGDSDAKKTLMDELFTKGAVPHLKKDINRKESIQDE
jgi:DNA primase